MVEVDPAARQPLQMDRVPSRVANLVDIHLLTLPEGVFWLGRPDLGSDLMVRDCYSGLFDEITAPKFATQLRWVVTGNPGIGKTFFSGYFIYRLLQQNPQLTIVYEPAQQDTKNRYLLQPDGTVLSGVYSPADNFVDECFRTRRDDVWFIADGHTPTFYGNARTLLVTSPCSNFDKKLLKEYASKLYMPVWSWNELSCCLLHSLRRENADSARILSAMDSANERFRHWGGIARVVLGAVFGSDEID
ncbi:hypothetical protein CAOG_08005 [Capsaspora owczarzaki ATCC 30864]|uniref:hypothetical protein n=1 Tax=Capsaspora owczarzaki (strain ATCC 30864) TaxID=595528 RepID=UPI0001FE2C4F|nr:hypothetical protein CAOG_08005 [Capsaspora owczarzaki ATCC 30864]|eukprot:XP_004342606.1 hypothetical protein CAOG_08005 [Capsaspora owczarzaki ATCC 30864]